MKPLPLVPIKRSYSKMATILVNLAALCFPMGCAHPEIKPMDLTECALGYNEKGEPGGQCSGPEFSSQRFIPFSDLQHWVAKDPITDQAYWQACYLQKARNGK